MDNWMLKMAFPLVLAVWTRHGTEFPIMDLPCGPLALDVGEALHAEN